MQPERVTSPGMRRSKQDLRKGSNPTVVAKREPRTKEVGERGAAGVYNAGRVCSWAGKSQLGVVIAAKVGNDSEVTAQGSMRSMRCRHSSPQADFR